MLFTTSTFAIFFVLTYALYVSLRYRQQNVLLLIASYVFYGWWDWRFLPLLVASTPPITPAHSGCSGPIPADEETTLSGPESLRQPRHARVLQVLRVVLAQLSGAGYPFRMAGGRVHASRSAPGWNLILHFPDDELRDRRLPTGGPGDSQPTRFCSGGGILSSPRRRPDPAGFVTASPGSAVAPGHRSSVLSRHLVGVPRALQEGLHRGQPRADRQPHVRSSFRALRRAGPGRGLCVRLPDLWRLLRIFGHGTRDLQADGLRAHVEFPHAVLRTQSARILAPTAHQLIDLAARLPVRQSGWESAWDRPDVCQPDAHHAPGRTLGPRGVDFPLVGLLSRGVACRPSAALAGDCSRQAGLRAIGPSVGGALHWSHVPVRLPRLAHLPRRVSRADRRRCEIAGVRLWRPAERAGRRREDGVLRCPCSVFRSTRKRPGICMRSTDWTGELGAWCTS